MKQRNLIVLLFIVVLGLAFSAPLLAEQSVATTNQTVPPSQPLSDIVQVTAGYYHTCVLTSAGGVKCWGDNGEGQLGNGTSIDRYTPVGVAGLGSGVAAISTRGLNSCALTQEGGVKCWGAFALGDGTTARKSSPVDVVGLGSGVAAIAVGWFHSCALTGAGGVKCWGSNYFGQLGDGSTTERYTPVDVVGLGSGVVALTAGNAHTCALISDGSVKCWGQNENGQLSDGTWADKRTPVDVVGLGSDVSAIAAGEYHTCALTGAGGVKCWGSNGWSQLGDGTTTGGFPYGKNAPVDVVGLGSGVTAISAGRWYTCALITAGGVKCWGSNWYGELGNGTSGERTYKATPVDVVGLGSEVAALTAGDFHTCVLISDGGVKCWGYNYSGQLGDGRTTDRLTPANVI